MIDIIINELKLYPGGYFSLFIGIIAIIAGLWAINIDQKSNKKQDS